MLDKCTQCRSRILTGTLNYANRPFCSDQCLMLFRNHALDQLYPAEVIAAEVEKAFRAPCPQCGSVAGNDVYTAQRVTGMLLAWGLETTQIIGCAACGRKHRLKAALYCLAFGWWSPRAFMLNLFAFPWNLFRGLFTGRPSAASASFTMIVKDQLAENLESDIGMNLHHLASEATGGESFENSSDA